MLIKTVNNLNEWCFFSQTRKSLSPVHNEVETADSLNQYYFTHCPFCEIYFIYVPFQILRYQANGDR